MTMQAYVQRICDRLHDSLQICIEDFRAGRDCQGLEAFLNAVEDLEILMDSSWGHGAENLGTTDKILDALERIRDCIENCDVAGMTDVLEFMLYPMVKEMMSENGNETCTTE